MFSIISENDIFVVEVCLFSGYCGHWSQKQRQGQYKPTEKYKHGIIV